MPDSQGVEFAFVRTISSIEGRDDRKGLARNMAAIGSELAWVVVAGERERGKEGGLTNPPVVTRYRLLIDEIGSALLHAGAY